MPYLVGYARDQRGYYFTGLHIAMGILSIHSRQWLDLELALGVTLYQNLAGCFASLIVCNVGNINHYHTGKVVFTLSLLVCPPICEWYVYDLAKTQGKVVSKPGNPVYLPPKMQTPILLTACRRQPMDKEMITNTTYNCATTSSFMQIQVMCFRQDCCLAVLVIGVGT